jgi:hypothetical protein
MGIQVKDVTPGISKIIGIASEVFGLSHQVNAIVILEEFWFTARISIPFGMGWFGCVAFG